MARFLAPIGGLGGRQRSPVSSVVGNDEIPMEAAELLQRLELRDRELRSLRDAFKEQTEMNIVLRHELIEAKKSVWQGSETCVLNAMMPIREVFASWREVSWLSSAEAHCQKHQTEKIAMLKKTSEKTTTLIRTLLVSGGFKMEQVVVAWKMAVVTMNPIIRDVLALERENARLVPELTTAREQRRSVEEELRRGDGRVGSCSGQARDQVKKTIVADNEVEIRKFASSEHLARTRGEAAVRLGRLQKELASLKSEAKDLWDVMQPFVIPTYSGNVDVVSGYVIAQEQLAHGLGRSVLPLAGYHDSASLLRQLRYATSADALDLSDNLDAPVKRRPALLPQHFGLSPDYAQTLAGGGADTGARASSPTRHGYRASLPNPPLLARKSMSEEADLESLLEASLPRELLSLAAAASLLRAEEDSRAAGRGSLRWFPPDRPPSKAVPLNAAVTRIEPSASLPARRTWQPPFVSETTNGSSVCFAPSSVPHMMPQNIFSSVRPTTPSATMVSVPPGGMMGPWVAPAMVVYPLPRSVAGTPFNQHLAHSQMFWQPMTAPALSAAQLSASTQPVNGLLPPM